MTPAEYGCAAQNCVGRPPWRRRVANCKQHCELTVCRQGPEGFLYLWIFTQEVCTVSHLFTDEETEAGVCFFQELLLSVALGTCHPSPLPTGRTGHMQRVRNTEQNSWPHRCQRTPKEVGKSSGHNFPVGELFESPLLVEISP